MEAWTRMCRAATGAGRHGLGAFLLAAGGLGPWLRTTDRAVEFRFLMGGWRRAGKADSAVRVRQLRARGTGGQWVCQTVR